MYLVICCSSTIQFSIFLSENKRFCIPAIFLKSELLNKIYALSWSFSKYTQWKWASTWPNLQNGMCAQRRLRSAWASESLLLTWRKLGSLATHWAHSKDSDQTGQMPRLIWVFAGCTCHFVGFCHALAQIIGHISYNNCPEILCFYFSDNYQNGIIT